MSGLASEYMAEHNPRERRLFKDLQEKHVLTRQVRRLASAARRWQARVAKRRNKRWSAQYTNSIRRASARLEDLERQVLTRAQELRLRVQEELETSVEEVQKFEEQHRKEVQDLKVSHQKLREAKQALSGSAASSTGQTPSSEVEDKAQSLAELQRRHRRAERQARKEASNVEAVERELASEARDEETLTSELHRLLEEIEILRPEIAERNTQDAGPTD